jgi:hypothetical protein
MTPRTQGNILTTLEADNPIFQHPVALKFIHAFSSVYNAIYFLF